jgi:hypothetical protein
VIATDASWYSAPSTRPTRASSCPASTTRHEPTLLELCEKQGVGLVVLIDTEMAWVADATGFPRSAPPSLSGAGVVDIAADKQLTHWLVANAFPPSTRPPRPCWPTPRPSPSSPSPGRQRGIGVGIISDAAELAWP